MTINDHLAEIEARARAATPGPWKTDEAYPDTFIWGPNQAMVCDHEYETGAIRMRGLGANLPIPANADFIAHARTDIPQLVAALRVAVEALTQIPFEEDRCCSSCAEMGDQADAAVTRIEAALKGDDHAAD